MMSACEGRRKKVHRFLERRGIDVLVIEDCEGRRNPSLRYLSGHPNDALLFLTRKGRSVLMPWDVNLANIHASVDEIIPYNDFGRRTTSGILGFLEREGLPGKAGKISLEVGKATPFPLVVRLEEELAKSMPRIELVCRDEGADSFIESLRMVKDDEETAALRKAAGILNELIRGLERELLAGRLLTETDVALFIEKEARALGAEGTSFPTIAAGPSRSFGIHAFPNYGPGPFVAPGLSILDFGVFADGYAGDVTITLATGRLSAGQKRYLSLTEEAYALALSLCRPGETARNIARSVDEFFARNGVSMPHSLGHGLGLEVHEAPYLRDRDDCGTVLEEGMVFTLEPGLYHPDIGGVRLENDVLITRSGHEVLTESKILSKP